MLPLRKPGGLTPLDRLLHLAAFSAQRLSSWGLGAKLLALAALASANIAVGAAAYVWATGDDWPNALFTVYGVLLRAPGFTVRGAPTAAGTLVLNVVLIYSVFVFAIVLGAGIEEVKGRLAAVRSGEVGLRLQQHVLVLNWSPLAVPLLRQLSAARADPASPLHRRPVVLLADLPKPALDAQLAEALKGLKLELYVRSGQPWRLEDLRRVCAPDAACILLLEPYAAAGPGGGCGGAGAGGGGGGGGGGGVGGVDDGVVRSPEPVAERGPRLAPAGSLSEPVALFGEEGGARLSGSGVGAGRGGGDRQQQALKAAALMGLMTVLGPSSGGEPPRRASPSPPPPPQPRPVPRRSSVASSGGARPSGEPGGGWLSGLRRASARGASGGGAGGGAGRVRRGTGPRVIVQVPAVGAAPSDYSHLVERAAFFGAFGCDIAFAESSLNQSSLLDRLVLQTALQPGLASVCREALRQGQGSAAFRYAPVGQALSGRAFCDAWRACRGAGAWLVGVVAASDGRLLLNPSPATRLAAGDELVGLARGANILPARGARGRLALPPLRAAAPPSRAISRASTMSSEDLSRPHRSAGGAAAAAAAASAASPLAARPPVRVIVAGCGAARRQGLTEGFRRQAPPGSSIVFVHSDPAGLEAAGGWGQRAAGAPAVAAVSSSDLPLTPPPRQNKQQQHPQAGDAGWRQPPLPPSVRVREVYAARPASAEALLAAGVAEADALVLASCSEPSGAFGAATQAADAVLMCELLSLQELLQRCRPPPASDAGGAPDAATAPPGGPGGGGGGGGSGGGRRQLHVVCLVGSYGMRRTAKAFLRSMLRRAFSFELLIGDELVSAALVQIATHPHNGDVFERLLLHRRGGTQLAMVPAAAYGFGRGGGWATFGLVAEEVMQSGRALALGYRRADGRMLLAPAPDDLVRWSEGDELVVMADTEG